ncbi:hypothetical protein PIB30_094744 [Stylosanthes scabra]|uniref:SKP1 component POZ domain-containing protein n=1 Tax=Stylosanthes scabra TaxID=79078 RepID=A0ABU6ZUD1_9FABA|nr:hypothetical protein [Stylosanthes scabra]
MGLLKKITLWSSEKEMFSVEEQVMVKHSEIVKKMIKDGSCNDEDSKIPLDCIDSKTLKKISDYLYRLDAIDHIVGRIAQMDPRVIHTRRSTMRQPVSVSNTYSDELDLTMLLPCVNHVTIWISSFDLGFDE